MRRLRVALAMVGMIAALGGVAALSARYEGCAEDRAAPPEPSCGLPTTSPRALVADLLRADPAWILARDDDAGALVMSRSTALFVFPPHAALTTFLAALAPEARTALRRAQIMIVWLGAAPDDDRASAWNSALGVQLFHDTLTPAGCLTRVATVDDPEAQVSRRHANEHAVHMATVEAALVAALRDGKGTTLSPEESAGRIRAGAPKLHDIATVTLRETFAPVSALVILIVILVFYWWAASAGKEDSFIELSEEELRGDGALAAPAGLDVRVLSHALLHKDLKHLINNLFALWIGCVILEPAIGSARTLIVFLAGVIGGALARLQVKKPGLMIGASGGAFALQAAALVLLLHAGRWFLADDRNGYLIFLAVNFVLGIGASFLPGVAMAAHVGGAVTGFLLTVTGLVLLGRPALDGGQESPLSAAIAWGLAAVLVIAWIAAGIRVQRGRADLPRPDPET